MTIIAFVGSVFSPYYAWARERDPATPAGDHCAINVALYGAGGRRWTMTERSAAHVRRDHHEFNVGPSRLQWDGASLVIDIDEIGMPLPRRVCGRVRVWPRALASFATALDPAGLHRWGPIAPAARIEVELDKPGTRWAGEAYLDSNEGDEPIDRPFALWDWSRTALPDGGAAVLYDVRMKQGSDRIIAQRFAADGSAEPFEAPQRQRLPSAALWRIPRHMRSEPASPARVLKTLEDTPFYARSLVESGLFGQRVHSVHETLSIPRLVAPSTRLMLPFRMPRVR
ncbi:carotenoid 1,2-hydratase [Piscinibacter aquaticus]|uniref:Carotenoid 1,2-hydratase n=1 Tax=Piscinibacter aquaticus TaxID=392597 RepID=A0A5C6U4K2_9BURK|nr:carotenoid 1,2-hydratase [Piscinibacter aquaticus]